jgi:hypothetical protein
MAQTIRLTITQDMEKALQILRKSTMGTLNTTELIKMAVGSFAKMKDSDLGPNEMDALSSQLFYEWSKDDETQTINNIAHPEKLKPFIPKLHVRTR